MRKGHIQLQGLMPKLVGVLADYSVSAAPNSIKIGSLASYDCALLTKLHLETNRYS